MPDTEFWASLPIASATPFTPQYSQELSGQANGALRVADLGPERWAVSVRTTDRLRKAQLRDIMAKANRLRGSVFTFYAWDPLAEYPLADAGGALIAGSSPVIDTLDADPRYLKIGGLPPGYVLSPGDCLAFDWGDPVHRALHQVVAGGAASGLGVTPLIEVVPEIRAGAVVAAAVTLVRAAAEMMIVPGSMRPNMAGPLRGSLSFDAIQRP